MAVHERELEGAFKGFSNREPVFSLAAATVAAPAIGPSMPEASWWRAQGMLVAIACFTMVLATCDLALAQVVRCRPVSERTGEAGCWIMASEPLGQLSRSAVFWHLDNYPTRAPAEAGKGPPGTVVEAPGEGLAFTIRLARGGPSR